MDASSVYVRFARFMVVAAVAGGAGRAVSGKDASPEAQMRAIFGDEYARPTDVPYTQDNPYTPEKEELGHVLFFDQRLSKSGAQSCASCHHPGLGWEMGVPKALGAAEMPRKSQTLLNLAWSETFFWDGRADGFVTQFHAAMTSPKALAMSTADLEARIRAVPGYRPLFAAAFPGRPVDESAIARALEIYQRGIVSGPAPFDRWKAGDAAALGPEQKRGALVFAGRGRCIQCHSGWNFTDDGFHDVGLPDADPGRGKIVNVPAVQHAFKTPGLRSVNSRRPYMHDGSLADLDAVVAHYDRGGVARRPSLSTEIKPLGLSKTDRRALIEFLRSLTGRDRPVTIPQMPM